MKVTFVATALALATGVASQGIADLPTCAITCLTGGLETTGCGVDIACACEKEEFVSGAAECVAEQCSEDEAAAAFEGATALCRSQGVEIVLPGGEEETPVQSTVTSTAIDVTAVPSPTSPAEEDEDDGEETPASTTTTEPVEEETGVIIPPVNNATNETIPTEPPTNEDSAAGKVAVSGLLAAALGLAAIFGL